MCKKLLGGTLAVNKKKLKYECDVVYKQNTGAEFVKIGAVLAVLRIDNLPTKAL